MNRPFIPFDQRHGSRGIPAVAPITTPVADVADAIDYPEIARAIDHARAARAKRKG